MSRKVSVMSLVLLMFLLVACGGAGGTGGSTNAPALDQTYNEDGIRFNYPSGWIVESEGGQVFISSNQAALDKTQTDEDTPSLVAGERLIAILSLDAETATLMEVASPAEAVSTLTQSIGGSEDAPQFGDATDLTVAGKPAAKSTGTGPETDGAILAIDLGETGYAVVFGIAAKGELSQLETVLDAVAASLSINAE